MPIARTLFSRLTGRSPDPRPLENAAAPTTSKSPMPSPLAAPFPALRLRHLAPLIRDAGDRVHRKTTLAVESNRKRFARDAVRWAEWADRFSADQRRYAAAALAPVFLTWGELSGIPTAGIAEAVGDEYGRRLTLALTLQNTPSPLPNLKKSRSTKIFSPAVTPDPRTICQRHRASPQKKIERPRARDAGFQRIRGCGIDCGRASQLRVRATKSGAEFPGEGES